MSALLACAKESSSPGATEHRSCAHGHDTGRYRIEDVPVGADRVLVACGPFYAGPVPLIVDEDGVARVSITGRCGVTSEDMQRVMSEGKSITCTNCHALPAEVRR